MLLGNVILLLSNCKMVLGTVNFAWQVKYSEMTVARQCNAVARKLLGGAMQSYVVARQHQISLSKAA